MGRGQEGLSRCYPLAQGDQSPVIAIDQASATSGCPCLPERPRDNVRENAGMWGKRNRQDQVIPRVGSSVLVTGSPLPLSFRMEMVSAKELPRETLRLGVSQCPVRLCVRGETVPHWNAVTSQCGEWRAFRFQSQTPGLSLVLLLLTYWPHQPIT